MINFPQEFIFVAFLLRPQLFLLFLGGFFFPKIVITLPYDCIVEQIVFCAYNAGEVGVKQNHRSSWPGRVSIVNLFVGGTKNNEYRIVGRSRAE